MTPARALTLALALGAALPLASSSARAEPVPASLVSAVTAEVATIDEVHRDFLSHPPKGLKIRASQRDARFRLNAAAGTIEQLEAGKITKRMRVDRPISAEVVAVPTHPGRHRVKVGFVAPNGNLYTTSVHARSRAAADRAAAAFDRVEALVRGEATGPRPKRAPAVPDTRAPERPSKAAGTRLPIPKRGGKRFRLRYHEVTGFLPHERLVVRVDGRQTRYAVIDKATKLAFLAADYELLRPMGDGRLAAKRNGKWGVIEVDRRAATLVAPHVYDELGQEGIKARTVIPAKGPILARKGGRWGAVDRRGQVIVPIVYRQMRSFGDGLAPATKDGARWGAVDARGEVVVPFVYRDVKRFVDGLAPATKDGKRWGFIDLRGETAIPFRFTYATTFFRGKAIVSTKPARPGVGLGPPSWETFAIDTRGRTVRP